MKFTSEIIQNASIVGIELILPSVLGIAIDFSHVALQDEKLNS
jgi:hypothetical protein